MPSHRPPIHRRDFLHTLLRTTPVVLTSSYLLDGIAEPEPRIIIVDYGRMERTHERAPQINMGDPTEPGKFYTVRRGDIWIAESGDVWLASSKSSFIPLYRTAYVA